MNLRCTAVLFFALASSLLAQVTLISTGSVWRYRSDGLDQGTAWRSNTFDDASWPAGPAQFGWGDGDETTALFVGPEIAEAPITTYFRHSFYISNRFSIYTLTLRVLRDDGVIVYLNGTEIARNNMPGEAVDFQTFAASDLETNESQYVQYGVFPSGLVNGTNTLAVEIHQSQSGRQDGSFDLELISNIGYHRPQVTMAMPENGSFFDPGYIAFTADASDADGHVAQVQYIMNGYFLGSASDPPFLFEAFHPPGRYKVVAVAYDNHGYYTTSAPSYYQVGGEVSVNLLRGPYLQSGSPTGMVVRWRTDWPTNSVVRYGLDPNFLFLNAQADQRTSEHEVHIQGLQPDTLYHYEIGSATETFAGGTGCAFRTSPTNTRPVTVWAIGDSGTKNQAARDVRDAFLDAVGPENTDLWLMLGDNAYEIGTDDEYQAAVFDMYPEILRRVVLWPTLGNHDAASSGFPGEFPYFDIFTLPTDGASGGIPSGTEKYYSYDYANIHFVCLDSQSSDRSTNGPMSNWLNEDLAATSQDWIIAYWHQPPYTFGSHYSDSELDLIQMREQVLPILESYGVDLVLNGHSHVYERSFLLNGHYGYSWSLDPGMILDAGLGHDEVAPYRKPAGGLGAGQGTVYAVCGCSGEGGDFQFTRHPAMAINLSGHGSMILNIDGLKLDAQFLRPDGEIDDYFTIDKSQPAAVQPQLELVRSSAGATLSWPTSQPAYVLETAFTASTNAFWQQATNNVTGMGRRNLANVAFESTNQFFRLRAAP